MELQSPHSSSYLSQDPVYVALYGFVGTSLLLGLDRVGVFGQLARSGSLLSEDLADCLCLDPEALERALQSAMTWGLVSRVGQSYRLTDSAKRIVDPSSIEYGGALFEHFRDSTIPAFSFLENALKDGEAQWSQRTSVASSGEHAFSRIYENSERAEAFHRAMWRLSYGPSNELVRLGIIVETTNLVDLGGGSGAFAVAAARHVPTLCATVFDLPQVRPYCEENISEASLADRVRFIAGDFWVDPLPEADTYALGYILSDWSDNESIRLLARIRDALPEGGRVIILERLLDPDRAGPFVGLMQDLAMMLETGGTHRTEHHYRQLLAEAGFGNCRIFRSSTDKHAVVASR